MKGVFLDFKTVDQQDLDFSVLTSTLSHWELFEGTSGAEVTERIQDAQMIITNKVPITAACLEQASQLKCILVAATGCDHIDLAKAHAMGVTVCNVAGYSTASVIQQTIGFLISMASRLVDYHQLVQEGAWSQSTQFCLQNYQTQELAGKTLGIVGYGAIGKGVAEVAKALGMKVLIAKREKDTREGRVPLRDLLPEVDALTLHCPLTPETRNLIDAAALGKMKRGAMLVNVGRGGLVDEQALAEALLSGHLGGAAVDVLSTEPPPMTHPLLKQVIPRLIVTPHVAWATRESRQRLLDEIVLNINAFLKHQPRNQIL